MSDTERLWGYSELYRNAPGCYARAVANGEREDATGPQRFLTFKERTFYARLLDTWEDGIHTVHLRLAEPPGLVQCTCGLLAQGRKALQRSRAHLDTTTWELARVVIFPADCADPQRFPDPSYQAVCQACGLAGPVHELGAATWWREHHDCDAGPDAPDPMDFDLSWSPGGVR